MSSCAVLDAFSQGLVTMVTQVRVLASSTEIFKEWFFLRELSKCVGMLYMLLALLLCFIEDILYFHTA